ncbi:MAG: hypothetical protein MUE51_13940 [Thermoleophilia bacterium]|nr:hypothetical protein [Thermoleophilia bacterium]
MRQTIAFQATGFDLQPVQVEVAEGAEPPEEGSLPVALMAFQGGPSLVVTMLIGTTDAENMMNAFTEAEPMRAQLPPEAQNWEPEPTVLPGGMFWAVTPEVVGMSVTPPQATPDGIVPHWTLAFDDADGSQVQMAVSEAMCVNVVRGLAQVAHGELVMPDEDGAGPPEDDEG